MLRHMVVLNTPYLLRFACVLFMNCVVMLFKELGCV